MTAFRELTLALREIGTQLSLPPDGYRSTAISSSKSVKVRSWERVMIGYLTHPERDLSTAFNKRFRHAGLCLHIPDGPGDIAYCEEDRGFYLWNGKDWVCFGHRA